MKRLSLCFVGILSLLPIIVKYPPSALISTTFPITQWLDSDEHRIALAQEVHQRKMQELKLEKPFVQVKVWDVKTGYAGWTLTHSTKPARKKFPSHTFLLIHSYGSSRIDLLDFAVWMLEYECPSCRFLLPDLSSCGETPGSDGHTLGNREADDILQILQLHTRQGENVHIVGYASGAAAAILATYGTPTNIPQSKIKHVVSLASFSQSGTLIDYYPQLSQWMVDQWFYLMNFVRARGIWMNPSTALDTTQHTHIPITFIHGLRDTVIPATHSKELAIIAHKKRYMGGSGILVEGGRHYCSDLNINFKVQAFFRELVRH